MAWLPSRKVPPAKARLVWKVMWPLLVILIVVQADFVLACTFKEVETNFMASVKEFWNNTNKQQCFELCYDDSDCRFIKHEKKMCTIFVEGTQLQTKGTDIYAFERGSLMPICGLMNLNVERPNSKTRALATRTTPAPRTRPKEYQIRTIQANLVSTIVTGTNRSYSFTYYHDHPSFCKPRALCLLTEHTDCYYIGAFEANSCGGYAFYEYCENEATYPVATYTLYPDMSKCYTAVLNRTDPNPVYPEISGYALLSKFFVRSITFNA